MNKQITRENYEAYFLDYLEGELDIACQLEFQKFLIDNPDLKAELDEIKDFDISLKAENIKFESKEELKESISAFGDLSFNETAVARMEDELSREESENFDSYLETHPLGKKEYLQFLKTRLQADLDITFTNKSSLKRHLLLGINQKTAYSLISAAASIILLLSIFFFSSRYFIREKRQYSVRSTDSKIIKSNKSEVSDNNSHRFATVTKQIIPTGKNINPTKKHQNIQHKAIQTGLSGNINREQLASLELMAKKEANIRVSSRKIENNISIVRQMSPMIKNYAKPDINDSYLTPKQLATILFKEKILKEKSTNIDPDRVSFWDIADAGLNGLNKITGSSMKLEKKYNKSGEPVTLAFSSSLLSFEKPYKRHQ